ncbi:oligosaccharide flippase family protein [Proteus mirabilis]|uniref:oligosaccharide flippase family protein n=1 Tax=Proteus mirabilis TaxID=584 RepID=UPI0015826CB1|nr:oligosaccharide flippase family protein [Proteus mirabilis]MBG2816087.1 oligosaccharide flippase family protein [Proteus mirabilis]MDC9761021.1 oligosaccharide flippase family protein [Proteus mirabilis]MDF7216642.1 oligosaccharide flippase family protein [Proteus mirabilis]MDF7259270.1 oligosaccharide flippase family protein [Proteus mirabilis]MDF7295918.1 oligosaccharide flippase family protein [Proteus mirabilis]
MSLKKNIINLFGTQVVSYLVPLLQYPYLSRVLNTELLGLYIFSLSIIMIVTLIANFGFDISLPKKIAEGFSSKKNLGELITSVTIIKTFLLFISLLLFFIFNLYFHYYKYKVLFLMAIVCLANGYNFVWLYLGIEKLYIYSRINIITKLFSIAAIFLFIKKDSDFNLLFIIMACQSSLALIISYIYIKKLQINFIKIKPNKLILIAKESFEYFISRIGVSLYSTCGSFFIGILSGSMHQVAIYGVAEQLYKAGVLVVSSISTPLTPYMVRTKNFNMFFKVTMLSMLITAMGACVGIFFGDKIIDMIYGENLLSAYPVLIIFMFTILISVLGIHFGYPALLPLNQARKANYSVIYAGILQILLIFSIYMLHITATAKIIAITYLLCDLFMLIYRLNIFIKNYGK